jgi:hypothetical protein
MIETRSAGFQRLAKPGRRADGFDAASRNRNHEIAPALPGDAGAEGWRGGFLVVSLRRCGYVKTNEWIWQQYDDVSNQRQ